ncbi:outer membrane protein assembly factor BamA [Kingella kingae]|uniref:outer membrane protein assembly factor BamA n=1 Tax=Kingella kingae TaxID=504 RepID=UPI00041AEBA5|nr:outer membrane protein assembly factor BamA [Kingella kingae]MDK4576543.1 outer membrane protein assembly factor BamA [Kingella kingae]MDK4581982.1 outer membrane protein assembly factor BamA [Kingella kingae]MDK4592342.1 outer membrane protein assembly factor BamA [Kingella kingae]MDK4594335.1 outer membrane protein assembly factor BamA [Kingella kingae]MDK4643965.1 outer membrane protein assembly factor BamA [Kingella kingae]
MKLNKLVATLIAVGMASPVWADFTVGDFRIEGEQHTSEATVRSLLPIKVGDIYTETVGENIIRSLYASGFYENVMLEQNGEQLIITVKERPIISDLTIRGAKVLPNDAILKQMSQVRGSTTASDADLVLRNGEKSHDEKLAEFETQSKFDTAQALASAGLAKGDFFSQEALQRALQALYGAYREQGKNSVEIKPEIQELARNRVAITIDIKEGETTRVDELNFEGNENFSDFRLSRVVSLTDGTLFSWATKSDVFSWEKFAQDKARLEAFYHDKGYFDFRVDEEGLQRQLSEDKTSESVTIKVYEGERYHWGKANIVGDSKDVPMDNLTHHLSKLKEGRLSNMETLQAALAQIKLELQSAGYAHAQVTADANRRLAENGKGKNFVDITVQIAPGNRIAVRHITVSGNNKTRDEVIRRELRQMEGATFDQAKINRSMERLRQLGYFEDVNMQSAVVPENEQQVDLSVAVKERATGSLNASAGWSQDDGLVISGSVSQDNLFGTGKSASLSVSRSKVRQNANISFTDPYFTPDGVSMTYTLFGSNYVPYKLNTSARNYRMLRYGGTMVMGVPITEYDRVNIGLGVENMQVKLRDNPPYRYQRFVNQHGERNWLYKGLLSWYRNTTDDAYWPTKGYQANVTGEVALPGSGIQYYQLGHQQTWYFPLNKTFTLMLNGQFGISGRYGKTSEVPFMFNQTGGGLGSVRGFESGSLGPKVYDIDPIDGSRDTETYGGKFAANVNAELLFPFPGVKDSRTVRLSLFADAGSVWDGKTYNPNRYSASNPNGSNGYYSSDYRSTFREELRYSAGGALTWISPVGPIKLSYAYPLRKRDTDLIQRFQFQLGTVF